MSFMDEKSTKTVIRVATLQDVTRIKSIIYEKAPTLGYGEDEETFRWLNDYHTENHIRERIKNSDYITFIAEINGVFVGTAYVNLTKNLLEALYVNVERQGVGTSLVNSCTQAAIKNKNSHLTMSVYKNNTKMLNLAASHGFMFSHVDPDKSYYPETIFHILQKVL